MIRFLPILLLVVLIGWQSDHASCVRQGPVRAAIRPLRQYAIDAAEARERSAKHEAESDPQQAAIDLLAARNFRRDAGNVHLARPLACDKPLPDTK